MAQPCKTFGNASVDYNPNQFQADTIEIRKAGAPTRNLETALSLILASYAHWATSIY